MHKPTLIFAFLVAFVIANATEPLYNHVIFENSRMTGYYYYSRIFYQSPSWIKNHQQKLPVTDSSFTPGNALELQFKNAKNGGWRTVIYKPRYRGQDFVREGAILHIKLFVQSASTLKTELPCVAIGVKEAFSDSVLLSNYIPSFHHGKWLSVAIRLAEFKNISYKTSSAINVVSFSQQAADGKEHLLLVDQIEILPSQVPVLKTTRPAILFSKGFLKHVDLEWRPVSDTSIKYIKIYRSDDGGKNFHAIGIKMPAINRYADYTGETGKSYQYKISYVGYDYSESGLSDAASASTRNMTDDELLTMVQEACFRYYWEGAEKVSGLSKENIPGRSNMIATGASGFGMMALIVGIERNFVSRQQGIERFLQIVNFLEKAETFHGAYPHFVDGPTAKVEPFFGRRDNGGDLVETSFLMQGLLAARAYFKNNIPEEKQIRDKITAIWQKVEWDWYRKEPDSKFLYWHWSPDQAWVINHKLIGWNETMITYLLAIASPTHPVPPSLYYTGWASQDAVAQQYRKNWGQTSDGSMYTNGNTYSGIRLDVGVSNGGPLFFTHYSYMGVDPHHINDAYTNYFLNNKNIALINYRYCLENPGKYEGYGDSCWGLTACDGPENYSASEPVLRIDQGKMAPTGAVSSFPYTPEESMKALKNYYNNYGKFLWGEFGFRDAFNLSQNWCSEIYMGLNQAPMVVMIENYRSGLLWKNLTGDPDIQQALKKIKNKN